MPSSSLLKPQTGRRNRRKSRESRDHKKSINQSRGGENETAQPTYGSSLDSPDRQHSDIRFSRICGKPNKRMAPQVGLEPTTLRLTGGFRPPHKTMSAS